MTTFDERRAARIERLRNAAERAQREGEARVKRGNEMFDCIPMGQPILIGHYSEKSDRNFRARAGNNLTKGFALMDAAKDYEQRAEAAENNTAIFSDDPNALDKLTAEIAKLEDLQATMKAVNAAHAKFLKDPASLDKSDLSETYKQTIRDYKPAYSWEPHPIPPYRLTNNNANIRRLKERIKTISAHANDTTTKQTIGDIEIVDSVEDNRLQIFFPGKPSDSIRSQLKSNGFRWTPTVGCWQAYRGAYRKQIAEQIAHSLVKEQTP